jgi:Ni-sirohydrochlorin a,c-diamide reductive cyclase subunit CfbD
VTDIIHPRPNPIIAAIYTLRDMDVDVVVVHGPAGCAFMASRMMEEAGVRVVTSGIREDDLIFGASEPLIRTLKDVKERFDPKTVAVIGTCASMIIGEDMAATIKRADIRCNVFPVDCHGCMGDNTEGAIKALKSGREAGIISPQETERQIALMKAATDLEKSVGMAGRKYLSPSSGPTKLNVCNRIIDVMRNGGKVAVVMIAKKELAYRFADMFVAVDQVRRKLGGKAFFVANMDGNVGLPRIRQYCNDIRSELGEKGVHIDSTIGGLDEYAVVGSDMRAAVDGFGPDLTVLMGICHAYPGIKYEDVLITDQPRELANYLKMGYEGSVGEISSHSMVMGTRKIIHLETADTLRELAGI